MLEKTLGQIRPRAVGERFKIFIVFSSNGNDIEAKQNEASILRHFLYQSDTNKLILKL
jgi:hypothetical protein